MDSFSDCTDCINEKIVHNGKYDIFLECQDCFKCQVKDLNDCCIKPDKILVNYPRVDGKPTKRNFCRNCFTMSSMIKLLPGDVESLPVVTKIEVEKVQDERYKKCRAFYNYVSEKKRKHFQDQHDEQKEYYHNVYLKSKEWYNKRIKVLNRDKYVCQACLKNKATQVHHLTYERIYKEPLFDLVSVCDECHNSIHSID